MSQFKVKSSFRAKSLVSDTTGAKYTDPQLLNPWGVVLSKDTLYTVSNTNALLLRYTHQGEPISPAITTPPSPTGLVANSTYGFLVSGQPATLIVVTKGGLIAAYNPSVTPGTFTTMVTTPSAVYTGVTLGRDGYLYVANFATGNVEQYNSSWTLVTTFTDATLLAANYAPFNLLASKKGLIIAFALRNQTLDGPVPGAGNGYIDLLQNGMISRLISQGVLNAPWGLVASKRYLLVGNNGDGTINRFCLSNGKHLNSVKTKCCQTITLDGLWGLTSTKVKCGCKKGQQQIYTASGPNSGVHGLLSVLLEMGY